MSAVEWKKWWRSVDGEVSFDNGFHFDRDPDIWYFDIDPETQQEQLDDSDPRMVHVDYLYDNEAEAKAEAIEWCDQQEEELIGKMQALGIWSGRSLNREEDEDMNDDDCG